jgi:Sugar (and other) transporter
MFRTGTHQSWLVWMVMAFMGFFAISLGAVIWIYMSEVFPTRVRTQGRRLGHRHLGHECFDIRFISGAREEVQWDAIFLLRDDDAD